METTEKCKPSVRKLYDWEVREARRVFSDQLDYDKVRIHECTPFPDTINGIGTRMKKALGKKVGAQGHNAVTLGNHCYFPIKLPEAYAPPGQPGYHYICWLIHELTHVWQYQQMGWGYLVKALTAQMKQGIQAYDFKGEEGLRQRRMEGRTLASFNLEQQGDIARSYYENLTLNRDTTAWEPFVSEFQRKYQNRA